MKQLCIILQHAAPSPKHDVLVVSVQNHPTDGTQKMIASGTINIGHQQCWYNTRSFEILKVQVLPNLFWLLFLRWVPPAHLYTSSSSVHSPGLACQPKSRTSRWGILGKHRVQAHTETRALASSKRTLWLAALSTWQTSRHPASQHRTDWL